MRLARRIAEKGLSVRQVEDEVRRRGRSEPSRGKPAHVSSLPGEVLDQIRDSFFSLLGVMPKVRDKGAAA